MDPERQPLLNHSGHSGDVRCRRYSYRPLTPEEVLTSRQEVTWRRARFFVVVMFWAIMAMFLSSIVCLLMQVPRCTSPMPSVPPVLLNLGPLIASTEYKHSDDNGKFELYMS